MHSVQPATTPFCRPANGWMEGADLSHSFSFSAKSQRVLPLGPENGARMRRLSWGCSRNDAQGSGRSVRNGDGSGPSPLSDSGGRMAASAPSTCCDSPPKALRALRVLLSTAVTAVMVWNQRKLQGRDDLTPVGTADGCGPLPTPPNKLDRGISAIANPWHCPNALPSSAKHHQLGSP